MTLGKALHLSVNNEMMPARCSKRSQEPSKCLVLLSHRLDLSESNAGAQTSSRANPTSHSQSSSAGMNWVGQTQRQLLPLLLGHWHLFPVTPITIAESYMPRVGSPYPQPSRLHAKGGQGLAPSTDTHTAAPTTQDSLNDLSFKSGTTPDASLGPLHHPFQGHMGLPTQHKTEACSMRPKSKQTEQRNPIAFCARPIVLLTLAVYLSQLPLLPPVKVTPEQGAAAGDPEPACGCAPLEGEPRVPSPMTDT